MKQLKTITVLFAIFAWQVSLQAQNSVNAFEVTKSGQGSQSIIFIPGFACSGEVWNETTAKFGQNFTCYTLTMAGFAGVQPQSNSTFKNWENSIAGFIKENNLQQPIIVGHSMGGGLALAIAADYPELIGKIVVVDALPCLAALMNPDFKSKETPDCSAAISQIVSATNEQFYTMQKTSIPRMLADTTMQETVLGWTVKSDRKTFAEMYCDFFNTDLREKISTVKCPALILLEPYFQNIKPAIDDQYKNLKHASFQYADKGLHFIMYDDKEWYFKQLTGFLK
jgi:pimeloyl-ACP methyl ester carboxylesterase